MMIHPVTSSWRSTAAFSRTASRFGARCSSGRTRVVLLPASSTLPLSFAVVDDLAVVLSVPGSEPIDGLPYQAELVLRHLLILREHAVVAAFIRMHEATWAAACPIADVHHLCEVLGDPQRLLAAPTGSWR